MNYNYYGLLGYLISFLIYLYYFKININSDIYVITGSLLIMLGYGYLFINKYNELYNKKGKQKEEINGHSILTLFYLFDFILPINIHHKIYNLFALSGHYLLEYTKLLNYGLISMIIYYTFYTINNIMKENIIDKLQALSAILLIIYYYKEYKDRNKIII